MVDCTPEFTGHAKGQVTETAKTKSGNWRRKKWNNEGGMRRRWWRRKKELTSV